MVVHASTLVANGVFQNRESVFKGLSIFIAMALITLLRRQMHSMHFSVTLSALGRGDFAAVHSLTTQTEVQNLKERRKTIRGFSTSRVHANWFVSNDDSRTTEELGF